MLFDLTIFTLFDVCQASLLTQALNLRQWFFEHLHNACRWNFSRIVTLTMQTEFSRYFVLPYKISNSYVKTLEKILKDISINSFNSDHIKYISVCFVTKSKRYWEIRISKNRKGSKDINEVQNIRWAECLGSLL